MTGNEIRQLIRNSANRPFTIFAEGKSYTISHPEFAGVTGPEQGSGQSVVIYHKQDNGYDLIDVSLIVRVEVAGAQPK